MKREPAASWAFATYLKTQDKENNGEARVLQSDSADAVFKFQRDFVNMTWGPLSPTHFLSHDIMGWYWQAPSSCVMLWDFTGSQRRLNTNAALTVAPYVSDSKQLRNHPSNPHQWKKKRKKKYPDETNSGEVSQLTSDCHVSPTDPGTSASQPTVSEKYKHN